MSFALRGLVLIALLNSIVCFVAMPRQLHLFFGNFRTPAVDGLAVLGSWVL